tara:strand:+ start:592 stop:1533 length:942 start_codon:yes stop_codon:yes gene_type:complete
MNYLNSGVDVNKGNSFISIIKDITKNKNIGGFSGIYEYNNIKLVASTDGVGTKLELCKKTNKYNTIGIDLVAMCINDIICQGAKPLFFLDYYAMGKLNLEIGKDIINGINNGCNESECLLLGGETAEMPIIYKDKDFDLAGFSVGVIENDVFPKNMEEGDLIYGIESSGVHSNGFSLINKILETNEYNIEELMTPTKIYVKDLNKLKEKYKDKIKGFAHITGGGIIDNIPRIINEGYNMNIDKFWKIPDVFKWIYSNSDMEAIDMLKTYNCGIGMVIIFDKDTEIDIFDDLIELGEIIKSDGYKINYNKIIFD